MLHRTWPIKVVYPNRFDGKIGIDATHAKAYASSVVTLHEPQRAHCKRITTSRLVSGWLAAVVRLVRRSIHLLESVMRAKSQPFTQRKRHRLRQTDEHRSIDSIEEICHSSTNLHKKSQRVFIVYTWASARILEADGDGDGNVDADDDVDGMENQRAIPICTAHCIVCIIVRAGFRFGCCWWYVGSVVALLALWSVFFCVYRRRSILHNHPKPSWAFTLHLRALIAGSTYQHINNNHIKLCAERAHWIIEPIIIRSGVWCAAIDVCILFTSFCAGLFDNAMISMMSGGKNATT